VKHVHKNDQRLTNEWKQ